MHLSNIDIRNVKCDLRKKIKENYVLDHQKIKSNHIINNIISVIYSIKCNIIGIYAPMIWEPDILDIRYRIQDKIFAFPKIFNYKMEFVSYSHNSTFIQNDLFPSMQEPTSNDILYPELLIIPAIAFDIDGYRLGLGKGHYDKYLSSRNDIYSIGACFDNNLFESLPRENHDCRMRFIITESLILKL